MALVQSTKTAGNITVEASSPGLTPASVTISAKAVKLRPQVAVWEREVPAGSGITGPVETGARSGCRRPRRRRVRRRPARSSLSGRTAMRSPEPSRAAGGGGGGGETPVAIEDGKVDGANVSFRAGNVAYTGTVKARRRSSYSGPAAPASAAEEAGQPRAEPTGPRPAIGPPPDGSDPSSGSFISGGGGGGRGAQTPAPLGHYQGEAVVGNCIGPRSLQRGFITAARFRYRGWTALQGKLLISFCQHRQDRKSSNTCTLGPWAAA